MLSGCLGWFERDAKSKSPSEELLEQKRCASLAQSSVFSSQAAASCIASLCTNLQIHEIVLGEGTASL